MNYINDLQLNHIIKIALREDIGRKDITTVSIIPKDKLVKAVLLAKDDCIICGLGIAQQAFKVYDKNIKFKPLVYDGQRIKKGKIIARIYGKARSILTAERVALNFLCLLSGIATKTRKFADKVKPYKVKIMDTRKTIPGLRELQKYAVRIGGGYNHRTKLDEMILIKDNHLKVKSSRLKVKSILENINKFGFKREMEVKDLKEFKEALKMRPDIIMLDNMSIPHIKKAVKLHNTLYAIPDTLLEASGGISLKNIRKIASTGVDLISVGALTHSVNSVDISLEVL
jgi:nicotinate-nucleotide pyrophosphorylase (carboxylating)